MESEIRADLPSSSPIIAYGETRQPGGKKFLAIIAGSFVLVLIGAILTALLAWHIPFPDNTILLATVHGGASLPDGTPAVWQNGTSAHHPVFLGLAKTDNGFVPYSVGLVTDTIDGKNQVVAWPFVIASDAPMTLRDRRSLLDLLVDIFRLGKHSAFLSLDTQLLAGANGQQVSGPVDNGTWNTDARIDAENSSSLPAGDVSIDLNALPDAWPMIHDAMQQALPGLSLDERPTELGWTISSGTPAVTATYAAAPSTSTLLAFANAAGVYDETPITLPDGSAAEELGPPLSRLSASGTTDLTSTSSAPLRITGTTMVLGPLPATNVPTDTCTTPQGIFALSPRAVQALFSTLNIGSLWSQVGVRAFSEKGRLSLTTCSAAATDLPTR